jgi:cytochrome c oxidase subunit 4
MDKMAEHAEHKHPTPKLYVVIFAILATLTVATWAIAFVDLGIFNPVIALAIACTKATLVILFFMHVRYSSRLTMITISAGFFWLMILITLTLTDYLSRALKVVP